MLKENLTLSKITPTKFLYKLHAFSKAALVLALLICTLYGHSYADSIVIPATGGTNLCVGGGYVTLGNISVQEVDVKDFKEELLDLVGKNFTLVSPSTNFEFEPGIGTVQLIAGSGSVLNAATPIQVTNNSITINFSKVGDDGKMDGFFISGIRIRAFSYV